MSSKKQNRRKKSAAPAPSRSRITPSMVFIGVIVLFAAIIAVASALSDGDVSCPAGQVWSDAHGHCH